MPSNPHLTVHFANSADEAPRIAKRVEVFLHENDIPESLINKVLLCIDELITNIIAHAYVDKEEHAVQIECRVNKGTLELELRDDGVPFDPTSQNRPNTQLSVESREIGGLGIHLVMTLMDSVEYQREGDYNVLRVTKRIDID